MTPSRKKVVDAIVLKIGGKPKGESEGSDDSDDGMGEEAAFEKIVDAVNSGDMRAGADALKEFLEICGYGN